MSTHQQSAKLVANCIQINHNWHIKIQKKLMWHLCGKLSSCNIKLKSGPAEKWLSINECPKKNAVNLCKIFNPSSPNWFNIMKCRAGMYRQEILAPFKVTSQLLIKPMTILETKELTECNC